MASFGRKQTFADFYLLVVFSHINVAGELKKANCFIRDTSYQLE